MSEKAQQAIQNSVNFIIERALSWGGEVGDINIERAAGEVVRRFPLDMNARYSSAALEKVRAYARELLQQAIDAAQ